MKKIAVLLLLIAPIAWCAAQSPKQVEDRLFKLNALLPGASYEFGVGNKTTINLEAIIGFALNGGSDRDTEFGIYPGLGAEFRYYYNMQRRLDKGKNSSGNSGNYISFLNQFQLGAPLLGDLEYSSDYYYNVGVVYGLQRTYSKGFYWGISVGPAIFRNDFDVDAGIIIDARLGWVLGTGKKK